VVIEDCAHAHGARWRDVGVGAVGHLGSFSMQSSKLLTSGEGGIVLTNDDHLAQLCHSLIDCGRPKDPEGKEYTFGANYRLGELQAAILGVGFSRLAEQTATREANAAYLDEALSEIDGVRVLRRDPRITRRACYEYIFAIDPQAFAGAAHEQVCEALSAEGIPVWQGYPAMHNYDLFRPGMSRHPIAQLYADRFDFSKLQLPEATRAAESEAVWLNQRVLLGDRAGVDQAVEAIRKVQRHAHELTA
jgi:dTDP-4-amino-4,6-dideoxygalactose transaminase